MGRDSRMGSKIESRMGQVKRVTESVDDILGRIEGACVAVSLKNSRGIYTYANEDWSGLAEVPVHKLTGRRDDELPWGARDGKLIQSMDCETRRRGQLERIDRLAHFQHRFWMCTNTERLFVPAEDTIVSIVKPVETDDFCRLAGQVSASGITFGGISLSIKQLYLLHQLLFHVPQKQTARELGCSTSRINQYLQELRDMFDADDSKELVCALSAHGLFPLLERFELLFNQQWLPADLRFH